MSTIDTSGIDETKPIPIEPTTVSVRDNFAEIKTQLENAGIDIDALIAADSALGTIKTQDSDNVSITGGSITGITDIAITDGGTGQSTAQDAIDALTAVSGATDEYVLTKDTTSGSAEWKANTVITEEIKSVTATVATSALTVGLSADFLYFRSATLTSGVPVSRSFSTLSLVVPSGATLGTVSTVQSRLVLLAIDNAGTVELAIVNLSGGNDLSETGVISTTAIDATADSANVFYSTTARSSIAYRVVGIVDSTQTTAGTWDTAPTLIQGAGGNALTAMSSLGYGQAWQAATLTSGVTYYNTTGKPQVLHWQIGGGNQTIVVTNTYTHPTIVAPSGTTIAPSLVIPAGSSYSLTGAVGSAAILT